ncbi:hypothetical protein [Haloquadratum walsbyi]|uniref:Uncharacterized protein n=1 Tax=Haloquadratum walsbyi (strain DSM 16854 / JCM 12705 / C23) TaxID=768065 RepID=G0LNF8_HALWC|nr:hypothetical protein [Haloquadratum walsbyi]CCC41964.1 conserved hypothetical protein [Haloquadratum walsbyi C23]
MSGTNDTTDGIDDNRLSINDDDGDVKRQRVKEILNYRSQYIKTRADVESARKSGEVGNVQAITQLKAVLDSFLLDIRPVILQSQHEDVWYDRHVYNITLDEHIEKEPTLSKPAEILPRRQIEITGLVQLIQQDIVVAREWHEYNDIRKPTNRDGIAMEWEDSPFDRPSHTGDPLGETELSALPVDVLDSGFKIANDVLLEIGLDVGLSDDTSEIAEFDYSDLI